jgi:hypothetical protein
MGKNKKKDDVVLKAIKDGYNLPEAYFKVKVEKALSKRRRFLRYPSAA